jgi:hypothetical protein
MSRHSHRTWAVKLLQQCPNIPKHVRCVYWIKRALWVQLMNYTWIYIASYSDTVTTLLVKDDCFDTVLQSFGQLRINCEIKYLTIRYCYKSVVLNWWSNIKMRRYTDQCDCCEYLGLKTNFGQLCVGVKCKQRASHFEDITFEILEVLDLEWLHRTRMLKNQSVKHSTHSVTVSVLSTIVRFHFHKTFPHGIKFLLQENGRTARRVQH